MFLRVFVFALEKISASDWLRCQFLESQSKVVCICTLSAFYHMAKQHSKGISTQATDETILQSSVQYMCAHTLCVLLPRSPPMSIPKAYRVIIVTE